MRFLKFSLVLFLALFTTQANAAQPGWYGGAMVGLTIHSDADVRDGGNTDRLTSNAGIGFGLAGGYQMSNNIRAELEFSYRYNGADTFVNGGTTQLGGSITSFAFMANGFYDFDLGKWVPYLGAGIGLAVVSAELDDGGTNLMDANDAAFAWQIAAGTGYKLTSKFTLSLDYRLLGTTDAELAFRNGNKVEIEYFTHNIMFGGRYKF